MMKTTNLMKTVTLAGMLFVFNQGANAQFLKKLGKSVEKAAKTVEKTADGLESNSLTKSDSVAIAWDKVPVFSAQRINMVDANGKPVLQEDGTQDYRVFLVDQFGNKRSAESVKAQVKVINERIVAILAKVGLGAGIGALQNGASGAAIGAATGAVASIDDINMARKQKKSLSQQKKLIEVYQKNFTEEGKPINAKVDVKKLAGLDLKEDNTLSMTATDIKKELDNADFNSSDTSAWDLSGL